MRSILIPAFLTLILTGCGSGGAGAIQTVSRAAPPSPPPGSVWFEDNFDGTAIDTLKWRVRTGEWYGQEYLRAENLEVSGGTLKIWTKEEQFQGRDYTSGAIDTADKFMPLYGRLEMRAKLPKGQGIWPAFWTLAYDQDAADRVFRAPYGEIDIVELLGHKPDQLWMFVHWRQNGDPKAWSKHWAGPDFSVGFHVFTADWSPSSVVFLVDGVERFRVENPYIPAHAAFILLNTAVGKCDSWPGCPDGTTPFPQAFEIDYIRVWAQE